MRWPPPSTDGTKSRSPAAFAPIVLTYSPVSGNGEPVTGVSAPEPASTLKIANESPPAAKIRPAAGLARSACPSPPNAGIDPPAGHGDPVIVVSTPAPSRVNPE